MFLQSVFLPSLLVPGGQYLPSPYIASSSVVRFASSARLAGSDGAGALTPSLISNSDRSVDGSSLSFALSYFAAAAAVRLKYSRRRSVTRAFRYCVSGVMYVCCVQPAAFPSFASSTRSVLTCATNAVASSFGGGVTPLGPPQEASRQAAVTVEAAAAIPRRYSAFF